MRTETKKPPSFGIGSLIAAASIGAALAGVAGWRMGHSHGAGRIAETQAKAARYQCPMHPSIVQDHPGDCPICGMKLVKIEEGASIDKAAGGHRLLFYRSPMDPKITSRGPKKDEMGMDYLPVYADEFAGESSVPGQSTVTIDPLRQQLIGLTTAPVSAGPVGGAWRTLGRVVIDETRVRHVNVKVPGFVDRIYVDYVGKKVKKGDPLFEVYSPELLSAQQEYLLALRTRGDLSNSGASNRDGDALVTAARAKLGLWDVPAAEIERVARTGVATRTVTFFSPVAGVVTKKDVVEGMKMDAGAMPYEIVDLSRVWVLADVYESELRFVKEGMPATLTLMNAFPDREFKGKVLFVDPLLDPKTRTVKVRLDFANPTGDLRPEMFGEVVLHGSPREGLRIPQDAVIDSGTEKIAFIALGNGRFQPRVVLLGDVSGNDVEVVSGVADGEQVVTRANFLVDSESKLRASLAEIAGVAPPTPAKVRP